MNRGPTLCCWALAIIIVFYTLCHWVYPFTIWFYPSLLGSTSWGQQVQSPLCGATRRQWVWTPSCWTVGQCKGSGLTCWPGCHYCLVTGEGPRLSSLVPLIVLRLSFVIWSLFVIWSSFAVGPTHSHCATPTWLLGLHFIAGFRDGWWSHYTGGL